MKVKPLDWHGPYKPGQNDIPYDHVIAETPLGRISISWKSWKDYPSYCSHDYPEFMPFVSGSSLEEVKNLIQQDFNEIIMSMIEDD